MRRYIRVASGDKTGVGFLETEFTWHSARTHDSCELMVFSPYSTRATSLPSNTPDKCNCSTAQHSRYTAERDINSMVREVLCDTQ